MNLVWATTVGVTDGAAWVTVGLAEATCRTFVEVVGDRHCDILAVPPEDYRTKIR